MARGFVNHCLTTNFDDLLNDAFSRFIGDTKPVVCAHDSQISQIRLTSKRPKIIKLHGDFLYESIKNTSSLSVLEDNMQRKFEQFSKEIGLVIVGYSGCDESIMGLLMPRRLLAESLNFPHGVHWCILKGQSITPKLQEILTFNRVFLYQIEDFLIAEFSGS